MIIGVIAGVGGIVDVGAGLGVKAGVGVIAGVVVAAGGAGVGEGVLPTKEETYVTTPRPFAIAPVRTLPESEEAGLPVSSTLFISSWTVSGRGLID